MKNDIKKEQIKIELEPIAYIRTDFPQKYGIPRQSFLAPELLGKIVFTKKYRNPQALKGLDGFSHLWLLWLFEVPSGDEFKATVRPPKLGGNERMGVFATRSPFRPNPIGLSCVKLDRIEHTEEEGMVIYVRGADLKDGTAIFDIKPYIAYSDSHENAKAGFVSYADTKLLQVDFEERLLNEIPEDKRTALIKVLSLDPRDGYAKEQDKEFGIAFAGKNIRFYVKDGVLKVVEVEDFML